MRINSVPDVKCFLIIKTCYVHNQWYGISCATLYITYIGLHIKCQIFVLDLKRRIFIKVSNIKYHENRFNGSDVDTFGRTDRQTNTVAIFAIMRTH